MRFGGHETFPVREGWLNKGLRLLIEDPAKMTDEYYADWLGVGRNMGKSIKHWLVATGLAQALGTRTNKKGVFECTSLGKLIYENDPHFVEAGTWWILHVNLVNNPRDAYSWSWYFNTFNLTRFDRAVCVEGLRQHLQMQGSSMPSAKTLQRDISCLLSTYAKKIPPSKEDPEDASESPFTDLGLLTYFQTSGQFHLNTGIKNIHPTILGYAMAKSSLDIAMGSGKTDILIRNAARMPGGPGRCFVMTSETLHELLAKYENKNESNGIEISGMAGERTLRIECQEPLAWIRHYYKANH